MSMETWKPRRFVEEFQKRAGLLIDGKPGPQTQMALEFVPELPPGRIYPAVPELHEHLRTTPTPIDPADIRPGDVVEIRERVTVKEFEDQIVYDVEGEEWWVGREGTKVHLVSRPDPDAEVIEAMAKAMHDDRCAVECCDGCDMGDYEHDAERIIHSARERGWDVVRRAES